MPRKDGNGETQVPRRPIEEWRMEKGTPLWAFAAARVKAGWAQEQEVTEEEYDAAVEAALGEVIRV